MGLIPCWETGSRQPCAGDVYAGGEELPETPIEKGPHTVLKGISGKVTRGSNSTSTYIRVLKGCGFKEVCAAVGSVHVYSFMKGREEKKAGE